MFNGDPSLPWREQCSLPLHMVNVLSCSPASPPSSSQAISTATPTQSTASHLPMAYAPSLPHPMKMEQAEMGVDASMISSNCLNIVSLGFEDQLDDTSSLPLSSSSLFTTCPPLSSLTASIEKGGAKEEAGSIARPKFSYQQDVRRIGGGKLLSGRPLGLSDAGKLVQLRLVETGQLHLSQHATQISSPSLSASSPASPDTQQCSSTTNTTHILQVSYITSHNSTFLVCLFLGYNLNPPYLHKRRG